MSQESVVTSARPSLKDGHLPLSSGTFRARSSSGNGSEASGEANHPDRPGAPGLPAGGGNTSDEPRLVTAV